MKSFALTLALCLLTGAARAADRDACIGAYEQTQTLRKDGKLLAARQQAQICARDVCPALLAKDCAKWQSELDLQIPTVVFEAKAATGADVTEVKIKFDGVTITERLDGKPFPFDPGPKAIRFEAENVPAIDKAVVLKEGEHLRKVAVQFAAPFKELVGKSKREPGLSTGVWLFGGVAVAALTTSAIFGVEGLNDKSDLDACKPRCSSGDVNTMNSHFTLADVALGAGVVAGAAALYLFFTRDSTGPERTSASDDRKRTEKAGPGGVSAWLLPIGIGGRF